ncbi:hypothetical protein BASA61_002959 [Batrachochytrium salamandrivorans]|nr:hypothetical protein BASA61_002959 [Batrachochytrium salamandrivorans]
MRGDSDKERKRLDPGCRSVSSTTLLPRSGGLDKYESGHHNMNETGLSHRMQDGSDKLRGVMETSEQSRCSRTSTSHNLDRVYRNNANRLG